MAVVRLTLTLTKIEVESFGFTPFRLTIHEARTTTSMDCSELFERVGREAAEEGGLVVSDVMAGGPAAKGNLRPWDVIQNVNGLDIRSLTSEDAKAAIKSASTVLVTTVMRNRDLVLPPKPQSVTKNELCLYTLGCISGCCFGVLIVNLYLSKVHANKRLDILESRLARMRNKMDDYEKNSERRGSTASAAEAQPLISEVPIRASPPDAFSTITADTTIIPSPVPFDLHTMCTDTDMVGETDNSLPKSILPRMPWQVRT
mmetsp:Transcript_27689/g.63766  ORF Transcript_27689/g.63766 Transcript_27689/m.63766 type:complete len:259 (+) Transcript_27689:33-809(+)|eukprot:CAMPEP_0114559918 /NCGR_PEP_ID=MMETSP0114-20121206/11178_1 /TAXON_ID=31324 /ORGANISM="Goniomonas sp, Strain m" /LENGTH=258 /DNA_ID=CAMNT_0001745421 /DNA_START=33 /DNA_END=809 /DNA_ORIENTATION=+